MDAPLSPRCEELSRPSLTNFSVSLFILFGILVSYLPQHYRIISRRSSEGISPYFVLLGTTSGTCAFANILTLSGSREDMSCCKQIGGFECLAGVLGVAQVGMQWTCFAIILVLFIVYFPRATPLLPSPHPRHLTKPVPPTFRLAVSIVLICLVHLIITLILILVVALTSPSSLNVLASILGVCAAILASIQYMPQLYTTYRLQHIGSLSIPMMCIQTPGSFVWAASLADRLGWAGWSSWGVFVVTGCLQGGLLVMGILFEIRDWQEARSSGKSKNRNKAVNGVLSRGEEQTGTNVSEETPLLR